MSTPETINWIDVNDELPDEGLIMIVKHLSPNEPVWLGYLDDGKWHTPEYGRFEGRVTHWAEMPKGPE